MAETTITSNYQLPEGFIRQMTQLLGVDFIHFQECYTQLPTSGLRLNTLKVATLKQITRGFAPVPWCPSGFEIHPPFIPPTLRISPPSVPPMRSVGGMKGGKHPYHAAGLYYLQDPSAMAVAEILAPQPGERVLDLSAAPGGKSTHLSALMSNQGLLVANEIHPQRVWELAGNLERWGAQNVAITNETPERLAAQFGAFFDRVLVDAPCSGEGMFRKSEAARHDWSPMLVQSCTLRQANIMEQAAHLVRPGGRLAYSTCTFNSHENEAVVARFLDRHPDFELIEVEPAPGFDPGRPDWLPEGESDASLYPVLRRAVRLWPHRSPGEGHFIALLQKGDRIDFLANKASQKVKLLDASLRRTFSDFCQASLKTSFDPERLSQAGSYLYQLPEELPDLGSLKVIHPGWWLGTVKKGRLAPRLAPRFAPSHALALSLRAEDARQTLDLPAEGAQVQAYLRGETLSWPGEDGWLLVSVDGYPLGWGRRTQGVIKNYYPRGLRWY